MKILYKFLVVFGIAFVITVIPNLFFFNVNLITWIPSYLWIILSLVRFFLLFSMFAITAQIWVFKPLNLISRSLSFEDPSLVEKLSEKKDELGEVATLLRRFFEQRKELATLIQEKNKAIESMAFSEAKSRALLNAIPDLLFRINLFGVITDYHTPDPKELYLPPEKFLGKSIEEILPASIVKEYQTALKELLTTKKSRAFEYSLKMPDGIERNYEAQLSQTGTGDYLVAIRNITLRKKAEQEIIQTLEEQQELNRTKSTFISLISHELRSPLAAISSNTQLLSRYEEKWPMEKKLLVLRRIQDAIQHMVTLLDEISFISRDQSGTLVPSVAKISVTRFIEDIIGEFRKNVDAAVRLELDMDTGNDFMATDQEILRQILLHLLSNAAKFTKEEKPIHMFISSGNSKIHFSVKDQGIGIPANELPQIFQPFHRASNAEGYPGAGLGMSLVKRSVDLLKGSVEIKSNLNEGTFVEIILPRET